MSSSQEEILKKTSEVIHRFQLKQELINSIFYILFVLFIFYFLEIDFTVLNVSLVIVISFLYAFGKEMYFHRRNKRMLEYQYDFIEKKSEELELMVPIVSRKARRLALKPSALVIKGNHLYLEAFQQSMGIGLPSESIIVPYGDDFIINQIEDDSKLPIVKYTGTLVKTDYEFVTIQHPAIQKMAQLYLVTERNNNDANTAQ